MLNTFEYSYNGDLTYHSFNADGRRTARRHSKRLGGRVKGMTKKLLNSLAAQRGTPTESRVGIPCVRTHRAKV